MTDSSGPRPGSIAWRDLTVAGLPAPVPRLLAALP
jgi:hypothetical protein